MDDLDRVLAGEPAIEPSAGFTANVMRAVVLAEPAPSTPFPWRRVVLGSAACGVLAWIGSVPVGSIDSDTWALVAQDLAPAAPALGWTTLVLALVLGYLQLQKARASD